METGDSETSIKEVVDVKAQEKYDIIPSKLECIGHVVSSEAMKQRPKYRAMEQWPSG